MKKENFRIKLVTNFSFQGSKSGEMVLPENAATMEDLLGYIGEQIDFSFMAADGITLRRNLEVTINGKDLWFYPAGLKPPLKAGDAVDVSLTPLGGG